jgi:hypothetical protein
VRRASTFAMRSLRAFGESAAGVPGRLAERASRCERLPRCCTGQRRFMDARVESDIRQNLEWAAVDHHDAEPLNALVVVVFRGSIVRDATCCLAERMPRIGCAWRRQGEIANDRFTMLDMTLRSRRWGNELSFVSACCRMHMTLSAATARNRLSGHKSGRAVRRSCRAFPPRSREPALLHVTTQRRVRRHRPSDGSVSRWIPAPESSLVPRRRPPPLFAVVRTGHAVDPMSPSTHTGIGRDRDDVPRRHQRIPE